MSRTLRLRTLSAAALAAGTFAVASNADAQTTVIDLASLGSVHPGFRIDGRAAYDQSGYSVSGAGDVNGDGLGDVIVGAGSADPGGRTGAGEAYIVFGKAGTASVDLNSLGQSGFRIEGAESYDVAGHSVSGAGDVNGDGLADVVVGIPRTGPGIFGEGRACIVFGKSDGGTVALANLGSGGFFIDGADPARIAGYSVSGVGDVNGDGLADLIAGAPRSTPLGRNQAGQSFVVFGKAGPATVSLGALGDGGFRIDGAFDSDFSGTVSGAGDVNGDGLADLVLGAQLASRGNESYVGECYVVFGKTDGASVDLAALGTGGFRIGGSTPFAFLGRGVAGAGDVNGDGLADIVVGAPGADIGSSIGAGQSFVVFGRATATPVDLSLPAFGGIRIDGFVQEDFSGWSVSGVGDLDADGNADLAIGTSHAVPGDVSGGRSFVVFGGPEETIVSLNSLGGRGFRIGGIDSGDNAGSGVSGAGDMNGDGRPDLVVGAPGADPGGHSEAGESYVLFDPIAPATASVAYRATARSGNAPRVPIGICGDGSDDDSPSSRCWVDFDGGAGPGLAGSSMQTVALARNDAGIRILKPERLANVQWRAETNRTGWRKTRVTLKYTDAEIAGLHEDTLRVWQASSPRGPWALYSSGMVREPQRNRISVVVPKLGYFAIEGEPGS